MDNNKCDEIIKLHKEAIELLSTQKSLTKILEGVDEFYIHSYGNLIKTEHRKVLYQIVNKTKTKPSC